MLPLKRFATRSIDKIVYLANLKTVSLGSAQNWVSVNRKNYRNPFRFTSRFLFSSKTKKVDLLSLLLLNLVGCCSLTMGMCTSKRSEEKERHAITAVPTTEDSPLKFGRGAGGESTTTSGNLFGARKTLKTSSFVNKDNLKQRPNVKHRKQRKA